jgi:hypothetical protein
MYREGDKQEETG